MGKKKNLKKIKKPARLHFCSYLGDSQGCGTIRVITPYFLLNHFRKKNLSCNATYLMNFVFEPNWYGSYTFVQFQRAATPQHLELIKHFKNVVQKKFNIPVIYEIDDLLITGKEENSGIPKWNYASLYYNGKNEEVIKNIMRNCDAMITSTAKLKEIYSPYCKKISVIPNHLPKFIWGEPYPAHEYYNEKNKIKILWAGSQNHFSMERVVGKENTGGDFGKVLLDFIRKTTDKYEWHLMGAIPEELNDIKNKIVFHPWENTFNYPRKMKSIEPDICIAPLQDIEFNRCKSSIKCIEYCAAGAPGVYSDVTPYKFQTMTGKTDEEMISHIEALADDINLRAKVYNKDYKRVESQLWWDEKNIYKYVNTYLGLFGQCL